MPDEQRLFTSGTLVVVRLGALGPELLFPAIGKASPMFQTAEQGVQTVTAHAGASTIGRFASI